MDMHNSKHTVIILAIVVIVLAAIFRDRFIQPNNQQVTINGTGEISARPDIAVLNFSVIEQRASTPAEALKKSSEKMNQVQEKLTDLGIKEKDIHSSNFSMYPEYDYNDGLRKERGYTVNQQLTVKIRNLDMIGDTIKAITLEGVNQIGNVNFEIDDLESLLQQARIKAIAAAKYKAIELAEAADINLCKVLGFWENQNSGPVMYNRSMTMSEKGFGGSDDFAAPIVQPGEQEITAEMSVTFKVCRQW